MLNASPARPLRRARAVCASFLAAFIVIQPLLDTSLELWPVVRDPEFGFKLSRLREQWTPGERRPLVLLLGSSRTDMGLNPGAFPTTTGGQPDSPVCFNFAMSGFGPVMQLALLRELLARDVVPSKVLIEVLPLFLNQQEEVFREEARTDVRRLGPVGLAVLCQFSQDPDRLRRQWWRGKLVPCHVYRRQILDAWAPGMCAWGNQYAHYERVEAYGWLPAEVGESSEEARNERIVRTWQGYQDMARGFVVSDAPDRALRELLDLCAERQIAAGIYLMPETSFFRGQYPADVRQALDDYLGRLREEYGIAVYDFSAAMPDTSFADGHHLLPEAVAEFSAQFASVTKFEKLPPTGLARPEIARRPPK